MKHSKLFTLLMALVLTGCSLTGEQNGNNSNKNTDTANENGNNNNNQSGNNSNQGNTSGDNNSGNQNGGNTTPDNGGNTTTDPVDELPSERRMQDTPILHCWNWSMNNISSNLQNIKDAGFKTIQLSPMQPQKDYYNGDSVQNGWWKLYQPLGFSVATGNNSIGTKSELTSMCAKAKQLGIDVIVDVVSNHLAGGNKTTLNGSVRNFESSIYDQNLIHTTQLSIDDNNLKSIVQGQMGDFPDLQTENSIVQQRVLALLKEYLDCGVNGFRFDAAKHIETPDDGQYASQYWPTILNGATTYAKSKGYDEPYYYGEILYTCGTGRSFSSYTKYMSVIDSNQGSDVLAAVNNKSLSKIKSTYNSGVSADKLVLWGESHDTYANDSGESKSISQDVINKAYAIQTSRKNASSLYLARPNSMGSKLGDVGSTSYKNSEIKAVNNFHNEFVGKSENITTDNGCFVNVRGGQGAVIVNINNSSSTNVKISASGLANGTYTETITNKKVTVSNSEVTVSFTNGVCVLVSDNKTSEVPPTLSLSANELFTGSTNVTVTTSNATSVKYSINNGTETALSGNTIAIPSSLDAGPVDVKVVASNQYGSTTKTIKLFKLATSALLNKSLIIYNMDLNYHYFIWGWGGSQNSKWYTPTYYGDVIGLDLGDCTQFIVAKFAKTVNTAPSDWSGVINQTEDISINGKVYNYQELAIKA